MVWYTISTWSMITAITVYAVDFIFFLFALSKQRHRQRSASGRLAYVLACIGLGIQALSFVTRWLYAGHIPVSNLFEFLSFFSMMIIAAFIVLHRKFPQPVIGVFTLPVALSILIYSLAFPQDVTPLIPALQSYWLNIHVTTAALGEGFFAVGFAAGFMYLLRTIDYEANNRKVRIQRTGIEVILFLLLAAVGFGSAAVCFKLIDYQAVFTETLQVISINELGLEQVTTEKKETSYVFPALIRPHGSEAAFAGDWRGIPSPSFEAMPWMKGAGAARKLNSVLWAFITGGMLYATSRLIVRRPLGAVIQPWLSGISPKILDEVSYRAVAIGFPIFTLGGLLFAMIWAHLAWSRFWGWDPKEVWALITWLFYSVYLHLRLSRGWHGTRSAWITVLGFIIVGFTLIGVNLIISGLHSYSGV